MLTHPNTDDRDRLFLVGQSMIALAAVDDYYVDDRRSGATLDQVGRNLSLCMSALDEPFLTDKYDDDTTKGIEADPVLVSLRQYIDRTAKHGTPQQVARVRYEDLALFVAICQEASWHMEKKIAPVGECLGGRQANSSMPYEEGTDPELRQVTVTASRLAFAVELGTAKAKEAKAIPLLHQRHKVAELFILIRLVADSADRYPAVAKSKFELRINRHPLLRLDFDREMQVTAVGSRRVRDRLEPLERALAGHRDSTCQDLARRVRTLRAPTASTAT